VFQNAGEWKNDAAAAPLLLQYMAFRVNNYKIIELSATPARKVMRLRNTVFVKFK
jgi:hypothetical protein